MVDSSMDDPESVSRALEASERERPSSASSSPEWKADLMSSSDAWE
jgi:hypothetical protein